MSCDVRTERELIEFFDLLRIKHEIILLHTFKKKSQQTPFNVVEKIRKRLGQV